MIGQALLVKRDPTNLKDKNAVAIDEKDSIVGHVPFTLPLSVLARDVNKAFAEVTGEKVNRGAGYRIEFPVCTVFMEKPMKLN